MITFLPPLLPCFILIPDQLSKKKSQLNLNLLLHRIGAKIVFHAHSFFYNIDSDWRVDTFGTIAQTLIFLSKSSRVRYKSIVIMRKIVSTNWSKVLTAFSIRPGINVTFDYELRRAGKNS